MERIFFISLVFFTSFSLAARHVFVSEEMSWDEAQDFCRTRYTGLLPLTNDLEKQEFWSSVEDRQTGWIGLYWDTAEQKWKWSGGTANVDQNVLKYQPNYAVAVVKNKWSGWAVNINDSKSAFCLNLIVVQEEEKTWEEALEHCRENHDDFTSLLSETENLLVTNQIQDSAITQRVWVGLRFLGDAWMWANGDPLKFQAWTQTGDPDLQCPVWKQCGALTKQGEWETRDCQEKLHFICV